MYTANTNVLTAADIGGLSGLRLIKNGFEMCPSAFALLWKRTRIPGDRGRASVQKLSSHTCTLAIAASTVGAFADSRISTKHD